MIRKAPLIFALFLVFVTSSITAQDATADDLQDLMDAVFPGTALILIDGTYITSDQYECMNEVPFDTGSWYWIPQGLLDPTDHVPFRETFFAHTLVHKANEDRGVLPAEVIVTVIEPEYRSDNELPIIPGALESLSTNPRAEARAAVKQEETFFSTQTFLNATGNALFEFRQHGLAEERRLAFNFAAEDGDNQALQVQGAIYNIHVPLRISYADLPESNGSFAALSGIVYSVTGANTIQAQYQRLDDEIHYAIRLETSAVANDKDDTSTVPVAVTFTAIERDDNNFGGFDILASEIEVDRGLLEDYQFLSPYHFTRLVPNDATLSGRVRLAFSNGCGGFLQLDLLFRDIPLTEKPE